MANTPGFDERVPIALAFAASVILHGSALVAPRWAHPAHDVEPPVALTVELRPRPLPVAPAASPEPVRERPAPRPVRAPSAKPPPPRAIPDRPAPPPVARPAAPTEPPPPVARPAAPTEPPPPAAEIDAGQGTPEVAARAPAAAAPGPPALAAEAAEAAARIVPPSFGAAYLRNPPPRYPAEARRRGVEGTVTLRVWVAADGIATRVEIDHSSGHRTLDAAALAAVKNWRFVPAQRGGEKVEGLVTVPLVFRLDGTG